MKCAKLIKPIAHQSLCTWWTDRGARSNDVHLSPPPAIWRHHIAPTTYQQKRMRKA